MAAHNFPWPNGRKKLLNNIIDELARDHPDALYAEVPVSPVSFDNGFHKITYRDFYNAINGVAWWMEKTLGEGKNFETLAYLGPNDLRHTILLLAAVKAGFKMLFTTPRYSVSGQVELMKKLDCKTMLLPSTWPPIASEIVKEYRMSTFEVPELEELLTQRYPLYEYSKTFEEAKLEPLVVLHTSGTTGTPKPVIWTHEWADSFGAERYLEPPEGFECMDRFLKGSRIFSLLPPFHAGHNFISLFFSVYTGAVNIYPLAALPPSAKMLADVLEHTTINSSMMVPPFVEELGADPETLSRIAEHVRTIVYAGGSISQAAGEAITAKIDFFAVCGSTEMGFWPLIRPSGPQVQENWKYMQFHPALHMRLEQRSADHYGTVLERSSEDSGYLQPIFTLFQQLEKYETDDLWTAHSAELGLWQHAGRADDMLVFASGEVYHPTAVENHIATHPDVQGALIAGTQRPQAALLLEMDSSSTLSGFAEDPKEQQQVQTIMEKIWPIIAEANEMCPVYAQVTKQHVLLIDPKKKALPRTVKGSVRRHVAIQSYREELDRLFENAAMNSAPVPPSAHSLLNLCGNIRAC